MCKKNIIILTRLSICIAIACGFAPSQTRACDVPVFRYALERWPADQYRAIAVEAAPFSKAEAAALANLRKRVRSEGLNLRLQTMEKADFLKSDYARDLPEQIDTNTLILFYPASAGLSQPVWQGGISSEALGQLADCGSRQALTKSILGGSSAVFLLLESGDTEKDNAARLLLNSKLKELNSQIKLPGEVVTAGAEDTAADEINQLQSAVPFKIDLTTLSLPKPAPGNSSQEILRHCLLGLEPDLADLQAEPMVFTIYGRGRTLPPLIGKGINERMIDQVALFITGACSCQVKAQNPGTDLLIQQDWDAAVLKKESE